MYCLVIIGGYYLGITLIPSGSQSWGARTVNISILSQVKKILKGHLCLISDLRVDRFGQFFYCVEVFHFLVVLAFSDAHSGNDISPYRQEHQNFYASSGLWAFSWAYMFGRWKLTAPNICLTQWKLILLLSRPTLMPEYQFSHSKNTIFDMLRYL